MIVKYFELKKNVIQEKKFFLLYGKNEGLIEETIKTSLKPILPKNIFNYEEKEILDDDPFREVYEGWPEHKMMVCSDSCGHKPTMEKIYGK